MGPEHLNFFGDIRSLIFHKVEWLSGAVGESSIPLGHGERCRIQSSGRQGLRPEEYFLFCQ